MRKEGGIAFGVALAAYLIVPDILSKTETVAVIATAAFFTFILITGSVQAYRDMRDHREAISLKRSRERFRPERQHPDLITLRKGGTGLFEEQPDGTVLEVPFVTFK